MPLVTNSWRTTERLSFWISNSDHRLPLLGECGCHRSRGSAAVTAGGISASMTAVTGLEVQTPL